MGKFSKFEQKVCETFREFWVTSYPRQGFLYRDHVLFHHHHQLDSLLVTHRDFTGHETNVIACQVKEKYAKKGCILVSMTTYSSVSNKKVCNVFSLCRTLRDLVHHSFGWLSKTLPKRLALPLTIQFTLKQNKRKQRFSLAPIRNILREIITELETQQTIFSRQKHRVHL